MLAPSKGKAGRKNGETLYDPSLASSYSVDQQLLFDLRRYLKIIVFLQAVFVATLLLTFGLTWSAMSHYSPKFQIIAGNAAELSNLAVPIVANVKYVSDAVVTGVYSNVNSTTVQAAAQDARLINAGRHLLDTLSVEHKQITEADLVYADYQLRKTVYKHARSILDHADQQIMGFNMSSVSDLLTFIVHGVDYGSISSTVNRVLSDVEQAGRFGTLSASMLGIAASTMNITLPSPTSLIDSLISQKQAASGASGGGGGGGCGR